MALLSLAEQETSSLCFCPHPWAVGAQDVLPGLSTHWSQPGPAGGWQGWQGTLWALAVPMLWDVATAVCPKEPPRGSQEMEVMLRDVCDTQGSVGTASPHHWVVWGLSPPC